MGRSGGGSFGGGGFGGGFSSGGGGFGGSFSGGNRSGGRSSSPSRGYGNSGGYSGGGGGGSWLGGFLWGNMLGGRRQTIVVNQPQDMNNMPGGPMNSGGPTNPGGPMGPSGPMGPNNGGLEDPNSKKSNGLGCLWILLAMVLLAVLLMVFSGGCSGASGIPDSTVERSAIPAGTAEVTPFYTDEDGDWIHNPQRLEQGLDHFYDETGVWPYVYILPNGYTRSSQQLTDMAEQLYGELFSDNAHFILVFCDNGAGGYNCGYYGGQQTRSVMDDEAVQILAAYLENYYNDYSLSEEEIFSKTFYQTADHIMNKTVNPTIPIAIVGGVIIIAIIVAMLVVHKRETKKREADRMERILNTPLEEFGDKDLEDLEKKYSGNTTPQAQTQPAAAQAAPTSIGVNAATADDKAERPE